MIEMGMRHEREIDRGKFPGLKGAPDEPLRTNLGETPVRTHAREEDWIGEDLNTEKIDENGGMAKPGRRNLAIGPLGRRRTVRGRGHFPPDFGDALPQKARGPRRRLPKPKPARCAQHG
jgi:hypothetical protein